MPLFNGTNKKDSIYGGVGNDTILGLEDDDNLEGDIGDDSIDGGSGNDYINGEPGADTLLGGDGDDSISGGGGNDLIYGGDGNDKINYVDDTGIDTVFGGAGNDLVNYYLVSGNKTIAGDDGEDTVIGATGNDSISGGNGNDSLNGSSGNDSLDGGSGNDYLAGDDGNDSLFGSDGNDTIFGGSGNDALDGGTGNDSIYGGSGNDYLNGNDGDDYIQGTDGSDSIYGGSGNDTLHKYLTSGSSYLDGGVGDDTIFGGNDNDTIIGGDGNDSRLEGSSGDDSISGGSGNDKLYGEEGNDTLDGGIGNDSLIGGEGWDSLLGGDGNDTLSGGAGNDFIQAGSGDDAINKVDDTGNDTVYGGDGNDTVNYFQIAGDKLIYGESGNDSLYGGNGNDSIDGGINNDYVDGDIGNDYLNGGEGNDSIYGASGNDTLDGALGNDNLYGGFGNDHLDGGSGNDTIYGGDGSDTIIGGDGDDSDLDGGTGNDSISGGTGNDTLWGQAGNDTLDGGLGNDDLAAGEGNDLIQAGAGDDIINSFSEAGNDTVYGGDGNDFVNYFQIAGDKLIYGESGNDSLNGGNGNDSIYGGTGNDEIFGNQGNDSIEGSDGNDELYGGDGNDSLFGGNGNDQIGKYLKSGDSYFDGGTGDDSIWGGYGNDTIIGGDGNDLWLEGYAGNDSILGGTGNDELYGDEGNDTLDGGAGNDLLIGGIGNDVYYLDSTFDVIFDTAGTDTAYVSTSFVKIPSSIENVYYLNGSQALPYWISALLPDEAAGKQFTSLLGSSKTFGYIFPSTLPTYDTNAENLKGFTGFSTVQKARTVTALDYISTILDVKFELQSNAASLNTFTFASNDQIDSGGYALYPNDDFSGSDLFLNNEDYNSTLSDGTYGAYTLMHEVGHALGLKHPFDEKDSQGTSAEPPYLEGSEDSTDWTYISYNYSEAAYFLKYSPLDIAALQYLYGPSKSARTGNDTYKISTTSANFLWDGAGSDSVDAGSVTQAATIYLTPGYQGYLGSTKAEKITTAGQITVNFGTVIENLIGSNYDDHLYGNEVGNKIEGGAGSDSIEGWDGDDTLWGGAGNDFLTGGFGNDSIEGGDGNDTLAVNGLATNYTILYDSTSLSYSIEAKSGSEGKDTFKSIELLKFSDKTLAIQSIDLTPPTIAISSNLSSLGIGKTSTISFTVSESVSDFVLGDVAVTGGILSNFTGSGSAYAATFTPSLNFTGTASIKVASGKFTDSAGNTNEDGAENDNNLSITVDTKAPVITIYSPENSATKIAVASDINLTFSENIQKGTGSVVLKTSAGVTVATYDVASSNNLTLTDTTLTINPTSNLSFDTSYKVEITSGAFKDLFANDLAAISTYSFTTGSNQLPTGNLTITGTPKQGQTLQATNSLADADGIGTITYQWQSSLDGNTWTNQATSTSLSLTESLVDKKIRVLASYIDGLGTKESAASTATAPVINVNDTPTGNVSIYGTLKQGIILAATNTVADLDGLGTITYQWQSSSDNLNWTTLGTGSTYTLQEAQVGKQIKVNALFTDGHGTSESVPSATSSAVANVNDAPTGSVVITGALKQGETLKVSNSIQDPDGVGAITYQWQSSFDGINWTNTLISSGDTLTLSEREVNRQISVIASYTDGHGTAEKLTSSPTEKLTTNFISGTSNSELIQGTPFADNISGYAGNDTITGGFGSDLIDGGTGVDTVKFSGQFGSGSLANYSIQKLNNDSWSVSFIGPIIAIYPSPPTDGSDTLTYVERIQFTDKSFAVDLDGNAGYAAKIIGAVLGKAALTNPIYVGLGLSYLDKGMSYSDLGALALNAVGATTNDAIVYTLWLNVIGSPASALDKAPFIKMLTDGMKAGDLVALAADTAFNTTNINLVGLAQTGIEYIPV